MPAFARVAALVVLGVLAACSLKPQVRAHVEAFSTLATTPAATTPTTMTVEIVPLGAITADALDFQAFAARLATPLAARGFTTVAGEAAWRLALGFGIDDGSQMVETFAVPNYGYGWGARGRWGYDPFYGYRTEVVTRTVFTRHLVLALADGATGEEVWRVRVVSTGRCPALSPVFDALVAAAFDGFPAAGVKTVAVELPEPC